MILRLSSKWDIALEDVHMNIEASTAEKTPASAKLHTARSRNDQVATDMRLFFKDACQSLIVDGISESLQQALLNLQSNQSLFLYLATLICNVRSL